MKKTIFILCVLTTIFFALAPSASAQEQTANTSGVVYIIPIRGMIEPALLYVIRRGLDEARAQDAKAIIFVMDTPGGTLNAANEIVRTIQHIEVPTYTFVEKDAFSAGAIIALATDHIYMAPGSVIGDAMPIMMSPLGGAKEMPEDIKEKAVSAVCALVRSAAQQSRHREDLAEKMVRRELELKIDGKILSPAGQLLTLTNTEAEQLVETDGLPLLSAGTVDNVDELLLREGLENTKKRELEVTATERMARFIAAAASLFLLAGLLGIYIEIKTPGFGIPGILGIISLAIFFWGHHIAGLAGAEDLVLFGIGALLLMVEILVIPGFGFVGFTGILFMLVAVIMSMVRHLPGGPLLPAWGDLQGPIFTVSLTLVVTAIIAVVIAPLLPKTPIFNRLVLAKSTSRNEGFSASKDNSSLLGLVGTALSALRPSGSARFGDRKLDVVTLGDYLEAGVSVRIVETHGNRIIVEADKTTEQDNA